MSQRASPTDQTNSHVSVTTRIRQGLTQAKGRLLERKNRPSASDYPFAIPSRFPCEYLDTHEGIRLEASTVEAYESVLSDYVLFLHQQGTSVLDAEKTDVIEYVEGCVGRGNRKSTLEGKLSTIKEMYSFIRLRTDAGDELTLDPIEIEDIDLDQYKTPAPIEREALSREEVRRLFDAIDSYRNRLLVMVAIETGLRNSDLRNIRLEDLDIDTPKIHVRDPKNGDPYDVPISDDLSAELEIWRENLRTGYGSGQIGDFLFPSQQGGKLETNEALNQIVKSAAKEAGIQDALDDSELSPQQKEILDTDKEVCEYARVTPHTLRHTCLTLMKDDDVPLSYRQLIANHHSPKETLGYTHGDPEVHKMVRDRYNPPR